MSKEQILDLIDRLRLRDLSVASQNAHREALSEAEKLTDKQIYPILEQIIAENAGKEQENVYNRGYAYVIYGCMLKNAPDRDACAYYVERLAKEKNRDLLITVLGSFCDCTGKVKIAVPDDVDASPVISLATGKIKYLRGWAITALTAFPGKESRDVLRSYISMDDEKAYKQEMVNSVVALQTIGEPEDIPLLERFLKSRIRDLKDTASYAIRRIEERNK